MLMMAENASREQKITELLKKYQRRYGPIYIPLVLKEEFLDIFNLETLPADTPSDFLNFSDDEWLRLKDAMVNSFNTMDYDAFTQRFFQKTNKIEFELKCNDNVCTLVWSIPLELVQKKFFQTPGAAMIREMGEYWIFMLFSNDSEKKKSYEMEMNVLGNLIEQLEEKIN